jgi:hypothetical protein
MMAVIILVTKMNKPIPNDSGGWTLKGGSVPTVVVWGDAVVVKLYPVHTAVLNVQFKKDRDCEDYFFTGFDSVEMELNK